MSLGVDERFAKVVASPEEFWQKAAAVRRERETLASQESQKLAVIELLDREALAEQRAKVARWKRLEQVGRLIRIAAMVFLLFGNAYLVVLWKQELVNNAQGFIYSTIVNTSCGLLFGMGWLLSGLSTLIRNQCDTSNKVNE